MTTPSETIAVLGAGGTMGRPMAANLAHAGFTVRAWNRTPEHAAPLAEVGGVAVCDSAQDAADGATIVLTMLSDAGAVLAAMEPLADGGGRPWLQMSTVGIDGTERCATLAEQRGFVLVDAPVLGTKQPAEAGELLVLASGPDALRDRLAPLFDAVGKRTLWLGDAGCGTRLKLVVNAWLVGVVEAAAEAIALAEGLDLSPGLLLDAVGGGPLDLPYLQLKGRAMIERQFAPSFRLALAAKDAGLVTEAAERHDLDLPVLRAIAARLAQGAEAHGDEDMAATVLTSVAGMR